MPLRPHPDVEPATAGGAVDGGVEIKLLGRALAGEAAEATERDLDVPGAELLRIVEIPELALVPDLDGATLSPAVLADADRSEEHTSELQSLMRISYAVFCLQKKKQTYTR